MKTSCNLDSPSLLLVISHPGAVEIDKGELHLKFFNVCFNYKLRNVLQLLRKYFFEI